MPKCTVMTKEGETLEVEADGYDLLRDCGFVILKKRFLRADGQNAEQHVAIFDHPVKVILPQPEDQSNVVSG